MTKIRNIHTNGISLGTKLGSVNVGSHNVYLPVIEADASPATITRRQMNQYDFFRVAQDDANTDEFDLPANAALGEAFTIYANDIFEIRTEVDAAEINGVADKGFTTVAKTKYRCIKTANLLDEWRVIAEKEDGTITTLTVDVAV